MVRPVMLLTMAALPAAMQTPTTTTTVFDGTYIGVVEYTGGLDDGRQFVRLLFDQAATTTDNRQCPRPVRPTRRI
jgi:hypothetical protein